MEDKRHPMIEDYERIINGYDAERAAAKLQRFVDGCKALQEKAVATPQKGDSHGT